MSDHEIDPQTNCTIWAADEDNNVVLPTGEIETKNLPAESEYLSLIHI